VGSNVPGGLLGVALTAGGQDRIDVEPTVVGGLSRDMGLMDRHNNTSLPKLVLIVIAEAAALQAWPQYTRNS
jgi:hypothetical protein